MAWRGDFGYTDLLDQKDVPKYDLRIEILGTLDEASSTLGLARAMTPNERSRDLILEVQSDLCWMMSELAATTEEARPGIHITAKRVDWLADVMTELQAEAPVAPHFIAPGDSASGGFVQLARTVVRRAERLVTLLDHRKELHNAQIITYLNRLSAILYVLARFEDQSAGVISPTPARPGQQTGEEIDESQSEQRPENGGANLIPLPYRCVSVQHVPIPLDESSIHSYLLGKEAYRRTDYVVLRGQAGEAIARVEKVSAEPLFSPITAVEVLALPDTCVWVADPEIDTGNPSAMAAKAHSMGLDSQVTLIVEGLYGHVNFLHHPMPVVIRVVEVIPPEPPKLLALARRVLSYVDDLPPIVLEPELVDLSAMARDHPPAPAYLFPCRAGGLVGPGPTHYLDGRPPREDWLLIGCERSRQIHRHFYGDEPPYLEMCPRRLTETGSEPTLLKCCLLESGIEVEGHTAIVPWGATLHQVEQGLRALVEGEEG